MRRGDVAGTRQGGCYFDAEAEGQLYDTHNFRNLANRRSSPALLANRHTTCLLSAGAYVWVAQAHPEELVQLWAGYKRRAISSLIVRALARAPFFFLCPLCLVLWLIRLPPAPVREIRPLWCLC